MRTKLFATGLAVAVALGTATPALAAPVRVTLPALTGPYQVGTTSLHLVDPGRADPWVPQQRRELMVTVDYPVRHTGSAPAAPWLSPALATAVDAEVAGLVGVPPGTADWGATLRRAHVGVPADPGKHPVVLFSHGLGGAREVDSVLVDDLASRGYVVVSMSHTHESAVVEFPGGRVETALEDGSTPEGRKKALDARVADTRFVLDELTRLAGGANPDAEHQPLPRGLGATLDLGRVGMFGHSYGGFTAGETMYFDRRIDAGINLDGTMTSSEPGEVAKHGLDRPFLLFGSARDGGGFHDHTTDPSWTSFWAAQHSWKRDLSIRDSRHLGFSDLQAVLPQLPAAPDRLAEVIGTVDPRRSVLAQEDYLNAFFDLHLRGVDRHLFDSPSACYPEVRFA